MLNSKYQTAEFSGLSTGNSVLIKYLLILLFSSSAFPVDGQKSLPAKPNIIFILADDIGYGDLSCYGAKSVQTPAVDSLAKSGILFTHAYSCASTGTPSRYGLLTGHYPWRRKETGIARGDAIVEFDWSVSQIVEVLKRLGLDKNTLIILSSDNGPVVEEGYKDQSREKLGNHTPGGQLRGGKYSAFEAGTRVPFLISWPGTVNPGSSNAIISHIDLMATLSALINRPLPAGSAPDSYNELNVWLGNSTRNRDFIVEHSIGTLSVIERYYKYIEPSNGPLREVSSKIELGNDPEPQLYNIKEDRGEQRNLARQYPAKVKVLAGKLKDIKTGLFARPGINEPKEKIEYRLAKLKHNE